MIKTYSPPFGFENDTSEIKKIIKMVKKSSPDILIIGLGCPKQELFISKYCKEMNVPISFCFGASLDFEAGNIKRAPKWMSDNGFEWLYRITQDPRRLLKRYLVDDIRIFKLIIKYIPQNTH